MQKLSTSLLYFLILGSLTLTAQQPSWQELMFDPDANLYEVQAAFRAEFPDEEYERGVGYKQFKRWEYYHMMRADEQGNLQKPGEVLREVELYQQQLAARDITAAGDWQELGPVGFPANGTGQPNGNGRLVCTAFHPTNANIMYVGAPAGGFWITQDGGNTWQKRSDGLTRLGVSSIVVHPTNTSTIYIGTGDRDAGDAPGYGVWRSTNGGLNWTPHNSGMGNRTVYEITMDPTDSDIMVAGTNVGIYRTTNGGATWSLQLSTNHCKDLVRHPTDPSVIYAARTRVYRSADGGVSWSRIDGANGLTPSNHNRIAMAVSTDEPNTVYALAGGSDGFVGLYRSTDNGSTWTRQSNSPNLLGYSVTGNDDSSQSWYDLALAADPTDAGTLYAGGVNIWKSTDAGSTWTCVGHWVGSGAADDIHADQHALDFSPHNGHLYVGNDGGFYSSTDGGSSWNDLSDGLAIAQIYRIGVGQQQRDFVINGYQDNGTAILYPGGNFSTEIGGDGMECLVDPTDDSYLYGALYYGSILRSSNGGTTFSTIAGENVNGIDQGGGWVTPYKLHPTDPNTMVVGFEDIWRTTAVKNGNPTWTNLTNLSYSSNVTDLAISPVDPNRMLFSQGNALLRSTNFENASPSFTDISANLSSGNTVKDIEFSGTDAATVWIAQGNDIYQSTDGGNSWTNFSGSLPNISLNAIVFDKTSPVEAMYVGMDVGVYYRDNTMSDWIPFETNLPAVEVTDLEIFYDMNHCSSVGKELYAATYGSGLWRSQLYDPGNVAAAACFEAGQQSVCLPSELVALTDRSSYGPTTWNWSITPNTFSFINGSSAGSQNPEVAFAADGVYTIQLTAGNANGSSMVEQQVTVDIEPIIDFPATNDLETANSDWQIDNPNNGSITWAETTAAAAGGTTSIFVNSYQYNSPGHLDHFVSENIDLTAQTGSQLEYDYAYAQYESGYVDEFRISVSTDCSNSWTTLYEESGPDLSTTGAFESNLFVPTAAQWEHKILDLSAYDGQHVRVRFTLQNDYGNNLYLDNIETTSASALPIVLGEFAGRYDEATTANLLEWTMLMQEPGLSFELQRLQPEPYTWVPIAELGSNERMQYDFADTDFPSGTNLYRLAILQFGDLMEYSRIVSIENAAKGTELSVFPNPSPGVFTVEVQHEAEADVPVLLTDLFGKVLMTDLYHVGEGLNRHILNLGNLPSGVYLLRYGNTVRRLERL